MFLISYVMIAVIVLVVLVVITHRLRHYQDGGYYASKRKPKRGMEPV